MDNSGSAFPHEQTIMGGPKLKVMGEKYTLPGLTKREWFAGMALTNMHWIANSPNDITAVVHYCYKYADAMLEAGKGERI